MLLRLFCCKFAKDNKTVTMEITQVRFVLDSFTHYIAEDKVVDFVKGIVGKKVLLVPDDNNEADINCIEGFYMGKACCHVSGRKSLMVRELMRQMNRRSLMVEVKSHNLEKGYKTVFCVVEPEVPFSDDFMAEHLRLYQEWKYAGKANVTSCKHRLLMANTDYLLDRLGAEDATEDELMPVVERYLEVLPMAFSREDKENCIQVNLMLQNSPLEPIRAYSRRLVEVLDYLNHPEQRTTHVREWIDELKASKVCQREASKMTREELKGWMDNLNDFPENLFESYETDFQTFCGNLYYNQIPCWEQQQFVNGIAVYELVRERERAPIPCEQERPHVSVLATEEAMCLWAKAQRANLADEHFQPTMESMRRASILARIMGEKLNLSPLWEPFEELWKVENLDNSNSQAVNANYYPTVVQMVENALK